MADEFRHTDVGTSMTKAEWEGIGSHVLNSQATGDIIYGSSATQLTRLGIGSAGNVLRVTGGVPVWSNTFTGITWPDLGVVTTVDINGGTIDGATIGGAAAGAGTFTTLNATGDVNISNGNGMVIGFTSLLAVDGATPEFQVLGTENDDSRILLGFYSLTAAGPRISFAKGRGAIGSATVVLEAGDVVGDISFNGADGTDFESNVARIMIFAEAQFASNNTPGYISLRTTPSGAADATEKWRITSVGVLTSVAGTPANAVTTDGAILATGGLAFTDVANAWIDDATHGTGTVTHYIGNETIDTTASDARLKTNITNPSRDWAVWLRQSVDYLREFDWREGHRAGLGTNLGFIAQEFVNFAPEYTRVPTNPEDTWSVEYSHIVPHLIYGWNEHDARITTLEAENTHLRERIAELERN